MSRYLGKVAVVTGASSGIGSAIVKSFVCNGIVTVGLARREDRLQQLQASFVDSKSRELFHPIKCDINDESLVKNVFDDITNKIGHIHVLVNNAGIWKVGQISEQETDTWRKVIETNVLSLMVTSREVIKRMRCNGTKGHVVQISSVAAHYVPITGPVPLVNVHPATKHAVKAISEVLRREQIYFQSGIKISCISPGLVRTEIFESGGLPNEDAYKGVNFLEPHDVAEAILYCINTPENVQVQDIIIRSVWENF